MGDIVNFLMKYYIYFLVVAIFLILALIGYIIDTVKTDKLKKELTKVDENNLDIPIATTFANVKLSDTLDTQKSDANASLKDAEVGTVNAKENAEPPVMVIDTPAAVDQKEMNTNKQ